MADKRISQLVDRGTVANNDVVPIVVSGATTTNKATISSIQTFMQGNLDLGVTSVGITLGSSGTDVSVSGSPITSSGNITINLPTASATNRGLLSAADWTTFNSKQQAITLTTTGTSGAATLVSGALNIPNYSTDLSGYVTLGTTQTITAQKTFTTSGSSDTMIISHGSGSGFALDVLKAGNGEAIRVTKSSGSGNAMTISGGNFEAPTIVKTGGTSSQFLKADGTIDSSTYLTTASAGTTYVPYTGAGANVDLGIYNLTANAVNVNASGSNAGVINLESNTIFSLVNGYGTIGSGTTNQFNFYQTTGAGVFRGAILSLNSITASATRTYTLPDADGTLALTTDLGAYLPLTGGTLTGALNGTSASFTGDITASSNAFFGTFNGNDKYHFEPFTNAAGGANNAYFVSGKIDNNERSGFVFQARNSNGEEYNAIIVEGHNSTSTTTPLSISSTGAATFSSSVTVGGLVTINKLNEGLILTSGANTDASYMSTRANNSTGWMIMGSQGTTAGYIQSGTGANESVITTVGAYALSLGTNQVERMRITSGGELLWNVTGLAGANLNTGGVLFRNNSGKYVQISTGLTSDASLMFFYKSDGAGGVTNTGSISTSGNLTLYNTTSDYRLKEDLKDFNALEKIANLKIYDFAWKADQTRSYGVLAHELAEVLPYSVYGEKDAVQEDEELKLQQVDYSKIVPILIKAIQEQQEQIDSLKNQIK